MKKWLAAALCTGLACGAGGSSVAKAQISPVGGGYLFRRKLQKGLVFNYALSTVIQAKGLPKMPSGPDMSNQKMTTSMKMTILDVVGSKAKMAIETTELMMNGQKMSEARRIESEITERGQVVESVTGGRMNPSEEIEYPEKPLKVGDVVPIKHKQLGSSNIRFIGFKPYKGKDAALWQMLLSLSSDDIKNKKKTKKPTPKQKITGVINLLISKEDGWPLSTTVTMDVSVQAGEQPITAKTVATIVRQ